MRRLVGFHAISRGVWPAERVTHKSDEQLPDGRNFGVHAAALLCSRNELSQHRLGFFGLNLDERAPKEIRASGGQASEGLADL